MRSYQDITLTGNQSQANGKVFTVSEVTQTIRRLLETQYRFLRISGEVSNLRRPHSGHLYFTLKDGQAQIKVVLFKMQQRQLSEPLCDGMQVICQGRLSVYEARGDYQLIVDAVDFHGTGALQLAFESLKKRLAAAGLFDQVKKKPVPLLPMHITLVTSPQGAAVHDFLRIAATRFPMTRLAVFPVAVQGEQAAREIARAIQVINQGAAVTTDMIVLCRGGGSIEDLWAFNEEQVAQEIDRSSIPVISAIGHEIDYTIADFVADLRAPTPSGAAEMLLPATDSLLAGVGQQQKRLRLAMDRRLAQHGECLVRHHQLFTSLYRPLDQLTLRLDHISHRLERGMRQRLAQKQQQLDRLQARVQQQTPALRIRLLLRQVAELNRRLGVSMEKNVNGKGKQLAKVAEVMEAVSPLATLSRGYSILTASKGPRKVITRSAQVKVGTTVKVVLHQGKLCCKVTAVEPAEAVNPLSG